MQTHAINLIYVCTFVFLSMIEGMQRVDLAMGQNPLLVG